MSDKSLYFPIFSSIGNSKLNILSSLRDLEIIMGNSIGHIRGTIANEFCQVLPNEEEVY